MNKPKVSIVSISYNQEKYIREALEGFVNQKTDFDYEIIIADDCSQDGTQKIIKEYAGKNKKIKAVLRKKNIGPERNFIDVFQRACGDYIAVGEGDDFWIDLKKIQRQASFLDSHKDHTIVFGPTKVVFENKEEEDSLYPNTSESPKFSFEKLLKQNFMQTSSVMYRRQNDYSGIPNYVSPIDWYFHLYHAQFGKIGFINRVMSVYRRHPGGMWWNSYEDIDKIWEKYGQQHLLLYAEFLKLYGKNPKYQKIIYEHIYDMFNALIEVEKRFTGKKELLTRPLMELPEISEKFIIFQYDFLKKTEASLRVKEEEAHRLEQTIESKEQLLQQSEQVIKAIKSSRAWKMRNAIARLIGRGVI